MAPGALEIKMKKRIFLLIVAIIAISTILHASERDGNGWRTLTSQEKSFFVSGLLDGIDTGFRLGTKDVKEESCGLKNAESFFKNHDKYIVGTNNSQIIDGLDSFYSDFKNRKIPVREAFFVILMQIAGDSEEIINKIVLRLRKGLF
jgi:hypothetical protein